MGRIHRSEDTLFEVNLDRGQLAAMLTQRAIPSILMLLRQHGVAKMFKGGRPSYSLKDSDNGWAGAGVEGNGRGVALGKESAHDNPNAYWDVNCLPPMALLPRSPWLQPKLSRSEAIQQHNPNGSPGQEKET